METGDDRYTTYVLTDDFVGKDCFDATPYIEKYGEREDINNGFSPYTVLMN